MQLDKEMMTKATEMVNECVAKGDDYVIRHKDRILLTIQEIIALKNIYHPLCASNPRILEVGGKSIIGDVIGAVLNTPIDNTTSDLRYAWSIPDNTYDLLINSEVIEHIKDQDAGTTDFNDPYAVTSLSTFNQSGLNCFLNECYRVLKPGGVMFLTTPNTASYTTFRYLINGCMAMIYKPHVREYCVKEMVQILEEHHFKQFQPPKTIQPWNKVTDEDLATIRKVIKVPEELLGEVMLLTVQKPISG